METKTKVKMHRGLQLGERVQSLVHKRVRPADENGASLLGKRARQIHLATSDNNK